MSIRVERLHEITEEDAISEGATVRFDVDPHEEPFRAAFALLWDSINAKRAGAAWKHNPMVARIEFTRVLK